MVLFWRRERDSNPCGREPKRFSRPPRYDHFDIPPYMNCRQADIIGYSIFLEIFLEMLFSIAFGVPEKSVFTRLFCVFATVMLANFQDRLVMTTSITLRVRLLSFQICEFFRKSFRSNNFLLRWKGENIRRNKEF